MDKIVKTVNVNWVIIILNVDVRIFIVSNVQILLYMIVNLIYYNKIC
jgi:hypothetical protein